VKNKNICWISLLLFSTFFAYVTFCDEAQSGAPDVFATAAAKITDTKTDRLDKIMALHAFVRDNVAETRTQYG